MIQVSSKSTLRLPLSIDDDELSLLLKGNQCYDERTSNCKLASIGACLHAVSTKLQGAGMN